jgi:uroporphyrin-III C-methyltransferase/precorrin-2 dehydrogenase/sirohydrochlorin ferrochelatase
MSIHQSPKQTRPARLGELAKLPIFMDLVGCRTVVAGGGEAAAWKIELLAAAGADVDVFAPGIAPEVQALLDGRRVRHLARAWGADDLDGAALAVCAVEDAAEGAAFAAAARRRKVPVNVVDRPRLCDFQFGAIVNRSPVVVAINTDGGAPVLGQAIRRRIEALLPASLGGFGTAARGFRERLTSLLPERNARRRFWERAAEAAFADAGEAPGAMLTRIAGEIAGDEASAGGAVFLVGAGPGDPELLTLKALRILQTADVILYDRLVTPAVLELARREAERIEVGKQGHGAACRQDEINALMIAHARAGRRVVRLKGGDPAFFSRAGEEVSACREAGIPVTIVPGVTTASAAAASLNLSLTHRDHANRVQFVTGHDRAGKLPPELELGALADPRATTVVYMPKKTLGELAGRLVAHGLAAETPVLLARNVSRPDESHERSTLGVLAGEPAPADSDPAIAVIGSVVGDGLALPAITVAEPVAA